MFNQQKFSQYVRDQVIAGRTLKRVAEEVGVSASMLCRIRNGKAPALDTLGRLCRVKGVSVDGFFSDTI